jgi:hypothetical protein
MKIAATVLVVAVALVGPQIAQAKQANTKTPLPANVLSARKIYVDNRTGDATMQNSAYLELAKWGRFQIVDSPQKADVVLRLFGSETVTFVPAGEKTYVYGPDARVARLQGAGEQVPGGFTRLTLVDPNSGVALWSEQRKTKGPEAKQRLIDGLRDAIEQTEKSRKN